MYAENVPDIHQTNVFPVRESISIEKCIRPVPKPRRGFILSTCNFRNRSNGHFGIISTHDSTVGCSSKVLSAVLREYCRLYCESTAGCTARVLPAVLREYCRLYCESTAGCTTRVLPAVLREYCQESLCLDYGRTLIEYSKNQAFIQQMLFPVGKTEQ